MGRLADVTPEEFRKRRLPTRRLDRRLPRHGRGTARDARRAARRRDAPASGACPDRRRAVRRRAGRRRPHRRARHSCTGSIRASSPTSRRTARMPAILGELLSAGLGVNGMSWVTSPACTELELRVVDWMAELLDLPERFRNTSDSGGGVIQGTASEATLVAVLSARWRATGGAINDDGDTSRLVAYATAHAHSSVEKALRIAGIGSKSIRLVDHDAEFAMNPQSLAALVEADRAAGLTPFFVCATRGTTSSMAFDPTAADRRDLPRCRRLAARRRGDGRDRRPRARVSLGQRRSRAGRQLLHQPAQVDGDQLRLRSVLDRRPHRPARGIEHPARVPAIRCRNGRRSRRPARLAGSPRPPVPRPQAVVRPAPRRRSRRSRR